MGNTRPLPQPWAPPGPRPRPGTRRRCLKRAAIACGALLTLTVLGGAALWLATPGAAEATQLARRLAVQHGVATPGAAEATQLARRLAAQHGVAYPGPRAPLNFTRPLVATEDHRFYSEPGIDLLAVGRVVKGKLTGSPDQGGATIEQQLAKMLYTPGRSGFTAELDQVVVAIKLNFAYSKQRILDLYAEAAYYGHGYYGLQQASCGYFGHPAKDLTVVQGAMLAGVVNAPSLDDPVSDPGNARARLEHVLARMVAVGYLSRAQGQSELRAPLGVVPRDQAGC